ELGLLEELKRIEIGVAIRSGGGAGLIHRLRVRLRDRGVRIIEDSWVIGIDADVHTCRGVQYQTAASLGSVAAGAIVIASGGYAGLFKNAPKSGAFGLIQSRALLSGATLTNLEFVFSHGYGKIESDTILPSEELPGAEIFTSAGAHVLWLEQALFNGEGT